MKLRTVSAQNDDGTNRALGAPKLLCAIISVLSIAFLALILIDAAELQSGVVILVQSKNVLTTERPALELGFPTVRLISTLPLAVLLIAFLRRWSLPYFLAFMLALILAVSILAACMVFAGYRFWRDYQPVSVSLSSLYALRITMPSATTSAP